MAPRNLHSHPPVTPSHLPPRMYGTSIGLPQTLSLDSTGPLAKRIPPSIEDHAEVHSRFD